jgi:CHAD domain-containing protein
MAQSTTAASFASSSIAKLLERLAYQVGVTVHSPGMENIHDLRVAVRRFEQALILFRQGLPGKEVKRIRRKLKLLMSHAGDVRDCDVAIRMLAKCQVPGVAAVKEKLAEERKAELPGLTAALRRWSARRSSSKWRAALLPVDARIGWQHQHLSKLARKFLAHGEEAAEPKTPAEALHEFRIEGKKFRYTLELLAPVSGATAPEWLEKLKPLQSALGDVHDSRMAREIAERFDAPGAVEDWLKKRQRKKTREFRRLWEESFAAAAENRRLAAGLRHTPRKPMGRSGRAVHAAARQA